MMRKRIRKVIQKASNDVSVGRMRICLDCPELNTKWNQCGVCKCFMNAKTKIEGAKCPLGKW